MTHNIPDDKLLPQMKYPNDFANPFYIAEIGSNHNGDMNLCKKMIAAAKKAGAHAVKFQSWSEKSLISKSEYEANTKYSDKHRHFGSLKEMVQAYQFTPKQHKEIQAFCKKVKITFSSSVFSKQEVDLLDELDVPFFKIASMDVNNLPLLTYVAKKNKPVLLSTGMASLDEIEKALNILQVNKKTQIILLHCISLYPPLASELNLHNIISMRQMFDVPVGFSDHTLDIHFSLASIALGAVVIEKHFTLDKNTPGWDHWLSLNPDEFKELVDKGNQIHTSLGSYKKIVGKREIEKRKKFRRSIVAAKDLLNGKLIQMSDLTYKRPGTGIPPDENKFILGRKLIRSIKEDEMLTWNDFI